MHPVIIQAIAAERTRETLAHATAARRARQYRHARRRPLLPLVRSGFAGRRLRAARSFLRGPRTA